jgi:hypothetical protein
LTTTYTFIFTDGKTECNSTNGVTRRVEEIISAAAKRCGGSDNGNWLNRGVRTMKVCFTGKNENNKMMFEIECAVYKPHIHIT